MAQLIPPAALTADENLFEFIRICRDDLTVFRADLNWKDWKWEDIIHFTKMGVTCRSATNGVRLDDQIIDFAKAYFRYQQGHCPTRAKNELKALRAIEAALLQIKGKADINLLDMSVLDEAAKLARIPAHELRTGAADVVITSFREECFIEHVLEPVALGGEEILGEFGPAGNWISVTVTQPLGDPGEDGPVDIAHLGWGRLNEKPGIAVLVELVKKHAQ